MNFTETPASSGLTEEQQQMYSLALNFSHQEMRPQMAEWDEQVQLNYITMCCCFSCTF